MKRIVLRGIVIILILAAILVGVSGCFGGNNSTPNGTASPTNSAIKPKPVVLPVVATTSGTQKAYFTSLDIKVKNEGAEGIVLVRASVTQAGNTVTDEMPVYLNKGETDEIKLTFPLVWKGGEFTYDVKAELP